MREVQPVGSEIQPIDDTTEDEQRGLAAAELIRAAMGTATDHGAIGRLGAAALRRALLPEAPLLSLGISGAWRRIR